jgi:hypothetical protein
MPPEASPEACRSSTAALLARLLAPTSADCFTIDRFTLRWPDIKRAQAVCRGHQSPELEGTGPNNFEFPVPDRWVT